MIIITGANGFIGQKLVLLASRKYPNEEICCLIKGKNNLPKMHNLRILPIDFVTKYNLGKIPAFARLIFHLAGTTDTAKRDHRCNDIGTKNLLDHLEKIGHQTHFIYTSSLAIYSGRKDCGKPIDINTTPLATDEYGRSKMRAEKILIDASKDREFKLTILRLPTVWGENPRKNSFLNFLRNLVKNDSPFAKINWKGKTALMNVDDMAKYLLSISVEPPKEREIIPVAAQNLTLKDIFKILTESQGKKYKEIEVPDFVWKLARFLSQYLTYFEHVLPASFYNYLWRASIVVDNPLWCKVNVTGKKFTS